MARSNGTLGEKEVRNRPVENEAEREAVQDALETILATALFRGSRNYSSFLRFVVERRLEGRTEDLKERSLGVDVFGRSPSYDTSADPVVRSTASEVRKRLAQFYRDPEQSGRVRIELPLGSYVPEFRSAPERNGAEAAGGEAWRRMRPVAGIAAAVVLCAAVGIWRPWRAAPASEVFWGPVLQSPGSLLVAFGRPSEASTLAVPAAGGSGGQVEAPVPAQFVNYSEAYAFGRIAELLGEHGRTFRAQRLGDTTLADLRSGASILIGGPWWIRFDWTTRLTDQWRFVLRRDGPVAEIVDRRNPSRHEWMVDTSAPASKRTRDYALVCRVHDAKTGNLEVVIAGITGFGTTAASEFLTDPKYLDRLAALAPREWRDKDAQIVLSTEIINNNSTTATIRDAYFW